MKAPRTVWEVDFRGFGINGLISSDLWHHEIAHTFGIPSSRICCGRV